MVPKAIAGEMQAKKRKVTDAVLCWALPPRKASAQSLR